MAIVAALRRRASRRVAIALAILPIVGAICPLVVLVYGDLAGAKLDYAGVCTRSAQRSR